jgi:hypothetical protein
VSFDVSETYDWASLTPDAQPSDSRSDNGRATPHVARDSEAPASVPQADDEQRKASQATQLVALAAEVELFPTPDGQAFATLSIEGHRETWPLRTRQFKAWLQRRFYLATGRAPNTQALQDALGVLEGRALFENIEEPVFVRLAGREGAIYLDLADEHWRAVEITERGWQIVEAPVRFRRPNGALPLPTPVRGGKVSELRDFVNVSDADWPLLAGWLIASFRPHGPYPVLALHGEQGTAKSTTARVLRALVDPNTAPLRAQPREDRDLMIAAKNGWLLAFDNLSHLPDSLSDAFCRLSTGGGLATRALYTDTEEVLLDAQRPVLLTGIEELATRGDLLDRTLVSYLPSIADGRRVSEAEFWHTFEDASGRLLGALLDALAVALRREPTLQLESLPRMADFARWVVAAEPGLGFEEGTFLAAYDDNRAEANELTLEASPIARPIREVAAESPFLGTATDLLRILKERAGEQATSPTNQKGWPKNGRALSGALRRIAPNLRAVGVSVEFAVAIPGSKRGIRIASGANGANPANPATHSEKAP